MKWSPCNSVDGFARYHVYATAVGVVRLVLHSKRWVRDS